MPLPIRTLKAKMCRMGEAAVGKTSLVRRFVQNAPSDDYVSTLGAKVSAKDLVVNKADLKEEVLVPYNEHRVRQYAQEIDTRSYMTSAKTGENVEAMFSRLARDVVAAASVPVDVHTVA